MTNADNQIANQRPWLWLFNLMQGKMKEVPKELKANGNAYLIAQAIETGCSVIAAEIANVEYTLKQTTLKGNPPTMETPSKYMSLSKLNRSERAAANTARLLIGNGTEQSKALKQVAELFKSGAEPVSLANLESHFQYLLESGTPISLSL